VHEFITAILICTFFIQTNVLSKNKTLNRFAAIFNLTKKVFSSLKIKTLNCGLNCEPGHSCVNYLGKKAILCLFTKLVNYMTESHGESEKILFFKA